MNKSKTHWKNISFEMLTQSIGWKFQHDLKKKTQHLSEIITKPIFKREIQHSGKMWLDSRRKRKVKILGKNWKKKKDRQNCCRNSKLKGARWRIHCWKAKEKMVENWEKLTKWNKRYERLMIRKNMKFRLQKRLIYT